MPTKTEIAQMDGEPFRFQVGPYVVDLEEFHGNGWCSCPDFGIRRMKAAESIRATPKTDDNSLRCKHILAARRLFFLLNFPKDLHSEHSAVVDFLVNRAIERCSNESKAKKDSSHLKG